MADNNALSVSLANNLINMAIQCDEYANVLFSKISEKDFDVQLDRDMFKACRLFYDQHKQTPGINQLLDIFQDRISDTPEIVEMIRQFQHNAVKVPKAVIDAVDDWKLSQTLQAKSLTAIKDVRATTGNAKAVTLQLSKSLRDAVLTSESKATLLKTSDISIFDSAFDEATNSGEFYWGIPPLDIYPELRVERTHTHVILMHPKFGKTTFLEGVARANAELGKKVLFVSLENSAKEIYRRLIRGWFGVAKEPCITPITLPTFNRQNDGYSDVSRITFNEVRHTRHIKDPLVKKDLRDQVEATAYIQNIDIVHFPRHSMTLNDYYQTLLRDDYDVVCLDYAAIAKYKSSGGGELSKEIETFMGTICGFASELNFAQFTVHQAKESAKEVMWLDVSHSADCQGIDRPVDGFWTVTSTPEEKRRNLWRLQNIVHRHSGLSPRILGSRNLAVQNFCQDWAWLPTWDGYSLDYLNQGNDDD
jgi:hypothetical protein